MNKIEYAKYRESDWWLFCRKEIRKRDKCCCCCGEYKGMLEPHHTKEGYKHLYDELNWPDECYLLCRFCHECFHNPQIPDGDIIKHKRGEPLPYLNDFAKQMEKGFDRIIQGRPKADDYVKPVSSDDIREMLKRI